MSRPIRWCFLAEPPRLTRGETPRLIPPQDEKSGALGLFCKWLNLLDYPVMTSMPPHPLVTRSSDAGREADMPRNKVQFQKGLSFIKFCQRY